MKKLKVVIGTFIVLVVLTSLCEEWAATVIWTIVAFAILYKLITVLGSNDNYYR